mmetsp:Transcript_120928/g.342041  ORF Transcript_120928/g.342041 Transcript_120928/m.342041 type:complete len:165 (-) Transcript_120928:63-557(-)
METATSPKDAHLLGQCKPCAYFLHKADGCRWGEDCQFCHLCDRYAIKRAKKAKRHKMKVANRPAQKQRTLWAPGAEQVAAVFAELGTPARVDIEPYFTTEFVNGLDGDKSPLDVSSQQLDAEYKVDSRFLDILDCLKSTDFDGLAGPMRLIPGDVGNLTVAIQV